VYIGARADNFCACACGCWCMFITCACVRSWMCGAAASASASAPTSAPASVPVPVPVCLCGHSILIPDSFKQLEVLFKHAQIRALMLPFPLQVCFQVIVSWWMCVF